MWKRQSVQGSPPATDSQARRPGAAAPAHQFRESAAEGAGALGISGLVVGEARICELMDAGVCPSSPEAMDVAEAQRAHISRWFYVMDHQFHVQKSDLYVHEPKFRAGIEQNTRPGAAEWLQVAGHHGEC